MVNIKWFQSKKIKISLSSSGPMGGVCLQMGKYALDSPSQMLSHFVFV